MEPVVLSRRGERTSCEISAIPDWDGFEKIVRFLEKYYGANIQSRADGPDARRWILDVSLGVIELHHDDPYGNTLLSTSPETDDLVERVAMDLTARLRSVQ
jgi:hypothetical protein